MKTHVFGILVWSLIAFGLYFVLNGIGWSPVITRHETGLTKICGTLSGILTAPFLWISPHGIFDGPQILLLMSLFWGVIFYSVYAFLRRHYRNR